MEHITVFVTGALQENAYLIALDRTAAAVIDPGSDADAITAAARDKNLCITHIILTHGHFDHIGAVGQIKAAYPNAEVLIHAGDAFCLGPDALNAHLAAFGGAGGGMENLIRATVSPMPVPDRLLNEGDVLFAGCANFPTGFTVMHTAGHSAGSVCLYNAEAKVLVSGDTVFAQGFGRTDLAGGDSFELMESLGRLAELPRDTVIFSGHGESGLLGDNRSLGL